jgi:predicted nucleic acid-binding protein
VLAAVLDPNVLVAAAIAPRGVCGQILDAAIDRRRPLLVRQDT